jgi:DNA (cytosine-5)-methyltransferase 1
VTPTLQNVVRHLDLFSGIGGFALAARMCGGIETVAFCEIEPFAQKVLAKNFHGIPIHGDIHTLKGTEYGTVDLITGGYPCQPFSLAGKRKGAEDHRHLWPELRRIVETARPAWVLCENVVGHVSLGLDIVLSDLDSIGYACGAVVVPACAVDARHRRDRVWIMAHAESRENDGRKGGKLAGAEGCGTSFDSSAYFGREDVADADQQQPDGRGDGPCRWEREPLEALQAVRERGGQEDGLSIPESLLGRVAYGIPDRVDRLRGLGNAIVPQVAAEILKAMMQADRHTANPNFQGMTHGQTKED